VGNVSEALGRLEKDLESGAWEQRHSRLLDLNACDCGYRLVVTRKRYLKIGV